MRRPYGKKDFNAENLQELLDSEVPHGMFSKDDMLRLQEFVQQETKEKHNREEARSKASAHVDAVFKEAKKILPSLKLRSARGGGSSSGWTASVSVTDSLEHICPKLSPSFATISVRRKRGLLTVAYLGFYIISYSWTRRYVGPALNLAVKAAWRTHHQATGKFMPLTVGNKLKEIVSKIDATGAGDNSG